MCNCVESDSLIDTKCIPFPLAKSHVNHPFCFMSTHFHHDTLHTWACNEGTKPPFKINQAEKHKHVCSHTYTHSTL